MIRFETTYEARDPVKVKRSPVKGKLKELIKFVKWKFDRKKKIGGTLPNHRLKKDWQIRCAPFSNLLAETLGGEVAIEQNIKYKEL